ncbi:hypothetical protein EVAR_32559_1 [Eumeta japonica]|uniref:Uncharacterized protein n=1 Tax=Eumeta variegata TaxID=151549 RepID=A0A4C1VPN6_EUMVA|nr:hypothetical protein EVAR_32559_1 [Eumeta japonica]
MPAARGAAGGGAVETRRLRYAGILVETSLEEMSLRRGVCAARRQALARGTANSPDECIIVHIFRANKISENGLSERGENETELDRPHDPDHVH